MKILVTGATGFIGNNLINEILNDEKIQIIASSRCKEKASKYDWFPKVKYLDYDINSNSDLNLFDYFNRPDRVIHLAWDGLPNYNNLIHIEKILRSKQRQSLRWFDLVFLNELGSYIPIRVQSKDDRIQLLNTELNVIALAQWL